MFAFLFNPISIDEAFELLIENRITNKELNYVSRKINRLRKNDWRLWFGRFLLNVRSTSEERNFIDACLCLKITLETLKSKNNLTEYKKFLSLIDSPALFMVYNFYHETAGDTATALLLSRAYQNGWGVEKDFEKAFSYAQIAASYQEDELYPLAKEILNSFVFNNADNFKLVENTEEAEEC